jgi:hypothetical protein
MKAVTLAGAFAGLRARIATGATALRAPARKPDRGTR